MKKSAHGFTLVELLVVIAIIAVLAAVVVLIVNPVEITKRSRDATRLADLVSLQSSINVAMQENANISALLCPGGAAGAYCTGRTHDGTATVANAAKADGTGWVKINLAGQSTVSIASLPMDPSNSATTHYMYCSYVPTAAQVTAGQTAEWEIEAVLESDKYAGAPPNGEDKDANDGGNTATRYEIGSDLNLVETAQAASATNCPF